MGSTNRLCDFSPQDLGILIIKCIFLCVFLFISFFWLKVRKIVGNVPKILPGFCFEVALLCVLL
jgi:hypothetical protein